MENNTTTDLLSTSDRENLEHLRDNCENDLERLNRALEKVAILRDRLENSLVAYTAELASVAEEVRLRVEEEDDLANPEAWLAAADRMANATDEIDISELHDLQDEVDITIPPLSELLEAVAEKKESQAAG